MAKDSLGEVEDVQFFEDENNAIFPVLKRNIDDLEGIDLEKIFRSKLKNFVMLVVSGVLLVSPFILKRVVDERDLVEAAGVGLEPVDKVISYEELMKQILDRIYLKIQELNTREYEKNDIAIPEKGLCIVVEKSKRALYRFEDGVMVKAEDGLPVIPYKIGLGDMPVGDKAARGDEKTPEGMFYFTHVNRRSSYHLSFGINYPAREDAKRGLDKGFINKSQYERILYHLQKKDVSSSDFYREYYGTRLGGAIFLHGGGNEYDWTDGCIAGKNSDIDAIYLFMGKKIESGEKISIIILP